MPTNLTAEAFVTMSVTTTPTTARIPLQIATYIKRGAVTRIQVYNPGPSVVFLYIGALPVKRLPS